MWIELLLFFLVNATLYAWSRKIDRDNERAGLIIGQSRD